MDKPPADVDDHSNIFGRKAVRRRLKARNRVESEKYCRRYSLVEPEIIIYFFKRITISNDDNCLGEN